MHLTQFNLDITGLTADSRQVKPGYLFAALPGTHVDGSRYIKDAVAQGAVAILAAAGTDTQGARLIASDNPRAEFAQLAAQFYAQQPKTIFAVTGTNGKTSTVSFLQQLWEAMGVRAASLGTLGTHGTEFSRSGSLTTPDPVMLHGTLADLAAAGIDHLALEASSHGLEQFRLSGVNIQTAIFTNLTRDHLDYHNTMENYFHAKAKLFEEVLPTSGSAVLNADSDYYQKLRDICLKRGIPILSYGENGEAVRLQSYEILPNGFNLNLFIHNRAFNAHLPLIGKFQVWNVMAAIAALLTDRRAAADIIPLLPKLRSVKGRIEFVGATAEAAPVFVDYAHTPDALQTVLSALREHVQGRLTVVFGCGGNRDKGKRPIMGRIAATLADHVIVTDDNPRNEDAAVIRQEVLVGCPDATEIGDRHAAIKQAVSDLRAGDILLIAGKGHESGQIVGDTVLPFDDCTEAQNALTARLKGAA